MSFSTNQDGRLVDPLDPSLELSLAHHGANTLIDLVVCMVNHGEEHIAESPVDPDERREGLLTLQRLVKKDLAAVESRVGELIRLARRMEKGHPISAG